MLKICNNNVSLFKCELERNFNMLFYQNIYVFFTKNNIILFKHKFKNIDVKRSKKP